MWTWPFVSRERFNEQRAELDRVRLELSAERDKNQRLWNWAAWRVGGGVAFDTNLLPEPYQPKAVPVNQEADEATKAVLRGARRPGQARQQIAQFEVDAEADYQAKSPRPARVSKEQIALVDELNKAADEGLRGAM